MEIFTVGSQKYNIQRSKYPPPLPIDLFLLIWAENLAVLAKTILIPPGNPDPFPSI